MRKYVVEVRVWVKQINPGEEWSRKSAYLFTGAEAEKLRDDLIKSKVNPRDVRVRKAKKREV